MPETIHYDAKGRKYLSVTDVARRLDVTPWAVCLALDREKIPSLVRGRLRLVRMTDVKKIRIDRARQRRAKPQPRDVVATTDLSAQGS